MNMVTYQGTLKNELIHHKRYATRDGAIKDITNEINEINGINETNETNETNGTDQIDQINEKIYSSTFKVLCSKLKNRKL